MHEEAMNRSSMGRYYLFFILIIAVTVPPISGCLAVPYMVTPDVTITNEIDLVKGITLTLDPQELLEKFSNKIADSHKNIEIVDEVLFTETAFTEGAWNLAQLLEPNTSERLSKELGVHYLVIVGKHELTREDIGEFFIPPITGAASELAVSRISAVIIDLETREVVCQINSEAQGKEQAAFYIVIVAGTIPLTYASAIKGLASETGKTIDELVGSGNTKIAILATETSLHKYQALKESQERDFQERAKEMQEIASQGDPDAQWELYEMQPTEENLVWLCRAADQRKVRARHELGKLYYYGSDQHRNITNVQFTKDIPKACMWFYLAWRTQNSKRQVTKDTMFRLGPYEITDIANTAKAMTTHELAEAEKLFLAWRPGQCDRDFSLYLGTEYPEGNFGAELIEGSYLAKLCMDADKGSMSSRETLGRIYHFGSYGIGPDLARAYMWDLLAADAYIPADSMQPRCIDMTAAQRSRAVQLLKEWEPGKCEQYLLQN
jgi:TPR repeat protein